MVFLLPGIIDDHFNVGARYFCFHCTAFIMFVGCSLECLDLWDGIFVETKKRVCHPGCC